jgi:alkylated DNA repair dioxygenase AlkB
MPAFLLPIRERAGNWFKLDGDSLGQASIVEYPVGAPIGWHRDIPQFGIIIGVSLGAACRMKLRKYQRVRSKASRRGDVVSIELEPRSVYLMSGPSRQLWQHSIPPVKELRYSIVMRTLRS